MPTSSILQFSNIFENYIHLTVSGLGTITGTTGHVFPLMLHAVSCKSDGYRPTLNVFGSAHFSQNEKSAMGVGFTLESRVQIL
jgi:hypothetical protein